MERATRQRRLIVVCVLLVFVVLSVVIWQTAGVELIRLVSDPEAFRSWVAQRGIFGKAAYAGMVVLQIVVAVIPGEPVELAAGYAFGAWQGLLLCEIGILLGSGMVFWLVKRWGMQVVSAFFPPEKITSLAFLREEGRRDALIFLVFLIPGTPKDILTYFVGLTPMKLSRWLWITGIARIPSVLTSTLAGAAAGESRISTALWIYGITAVISAAGAYLFRRYLRRKQAGGR